MTGKDKDGNEVHACDDKRVIDPALKESALLTGVFNRLARSCFYGVAVKEGDESPYRNGCIPAGAASATVVEAAEQAALAFEQAVHKFERTARAVCDDHLRARPTSAGRRFQAALSKRGRAGKYHGDTGPRRRLHRAARGDRAHARHRAGRLRAHLRVIRR